MKTCFKCGIEKEITEYYAHSQMADGHLGKCKTCTKKDTSENARKTGYDTKRYRENLTRLFKHKYSMMKQRVLGRSRNNYSVIGKPMMSKEEFLNWCYSKESMNVFFPIYNDWVKNGYQKRNSPSIDRIRNKEGYILGNLQWLTQQKNSAKYNK